MIEIDTDKNRLDIAVVHRFISNTYWAVGRTVEDVQVTIDNSYCFGVYLDDNQIGFARVVTDYTVFAYLMDVFILEEHQGKGYSSILMRAILDDPKLKAIKTWRLATSDAHYLYAKFGFTPLAHPENLMEKKV